MSQPYAPKKVPPLKKVPTNEIDDIVNEIGELEQGMGLETEPNVSLSELEDLASSDSDTAGAPKLSLLDDPAEPMAPVTSITPSIGMSSNGTLSLTVKGGTQVSLTIEVDGQAVTVAVRDGVLRVETAQGGEFKIPLRAAS